MFFPEFVIRRPTAPYGAPEGAMGVGVIFVVKSIPAGPSYSKYDPEQCLNGTFCGTTPWGVQTPIAPSGAPYGAVGRRMTNSGKNILGN